MGYSNDEIIKKTEGYFDIIVDRMAAITRIKLNNEGIYNREAVLEMIVKYGVEVFPHLSSGRIRR